LCSLRQILCVNLYVQTNIIVSGYKSNISSEGFRIPDSWAVPELVEWAVPEPVERAVPELVEWAALELGEMMSGPVEE
jgi:hypothetical protein